MKRFALCFLLASTALALGEQPPRPVAVRRGTVRKTIQGSGVFIPAEAAAIKLDLAIYRGELRIAEVAEHGSLVNEGDAILRLVSKPIERQLESDRRSLDRAERSLRQAEESARMAAEKEAEALEKAEIDAARAAKQLRGYREREKAFIEEAERITAQGRKYRLEDQADELKELEKMYTEDELVDATEEIVLKRSRRNFARSKASNELAEKRRLFNKEWYFPWREEDLDRAARVKAAALERLRRTQKMAGEKRKADLDQKRFDLVRQRERFHDLEQDAKQFTVRAPRRGILLHGAPSAAPWPNRLMVDATLRNRQVFATVADPDRFRVKTSIAERDIFAIKPHPAVAVWPVAAPKTELIGALEVKPLPGKGGVFPATVTFEKKTELNLRPGMNCKLAVILAEERDVALAPAGAVIRRDERTFLRCGPSAAGPFSEREVVLGISDGTWVAVREGLEPGEFVQP